MHLRSKTSICLSTFLLAILLSSCNDGQKKGKASVASNNDNEEKKSIISLIRNDEEQKVDVLIDGELFTSYIYPETVKKPVLYPIKTAQGTIVTRGFPLESRAGERVDHPHHVGLWFNYGDVNGLDFWNNSDAIPEDKRAHYGTIVHQEINRISSGNDRGELEVSMAWKDSEGKTLMTEYTTFIFSGTDNERVIDRITTLTALDEDVSMKDNKEGLLGIRVARELEHPADKPEMFTDASGNPTDVPVLNNEGVTGWYNSSEGLEGHDVWGARAKWMNLSGEINGEDIAIAIFDHPDNIGYPTYWHARGYGLYAANSLGQEAMSGGKETLNFILGANESVTFKHRVVIYSGKEVSKQQIDKDFEVFAQ